MLGLPIYQVRELAGHSGIKITDHYAHMARRYLHGQARQVATSILAFYCPGLAWIIHAPPRHKDTKG